MAEFQTLDLGRVLQTAEAIKSMRNDSITQKLQQQYMGKRNDALDQETADRDRARSVILGKEKAQQVDVKAAQVLQAPNTKNYVEQNEPDLMKNLVANGVDWNTESDDSIKQRVQAMQNHARQELGVAPPIQQQTIQGDGGSILQRDPTTGSLKQIVAPQRPDYGQARLEETQRHNKAMEVKGNQPASADNVDAAAQAISNYQQAPLGAFAMRSPYGQAVMAKVMEMNPDYQANEFGSRSKAFKDFASGKNGNQVRSFNVAISHLDSLQKVADAMSNGDVPLINKLRNEFSRQTGKAAPNTFEGMKKIVTDEIVKSIVGAGGGVADREEASRTISAANSPAQLAGIMNGYKELMAGQLGGLKQQYEQTTGRKDFERYLTEEAKGYLSTHEMGGQQQQGQQQAPPVTATGPNGQRIQLVNGKWQPM